jgi:hypothetical protein
VEDSAVLSSNPREVSGAFICISGKLSLPRDFGRLFRSVSPPAGQIELIRCREIIKCS